MDGRRRSGLDRELEIGLIHDLGFELILYISSSMTKGRRTSAWKGQRLTG